MLAVTAPRVKTTVYSYSVPFVHCKTGGCRWLCIETTSDRYSDLKDAIDLARESEDLNVSWRVDFDGIIDH